MPECGDDGTVTVLIQTSGLCNACGKSLCSAAESLMAQFVSKWVERNGGNVRAVVDVTAEGEMQH